MGHYESNIASFINMPVYFQSETGVQDNCTKMNSNLEYSIKL